MSDYGSMLPDATLQNPACGTCCGETYCDGDHFVCDDCGLVFDLDTLSASFLDTSLDPCGFVCDNYWHGAHKIKAGQGYDCGTCQLPSGHLSLHWTLCRPIEVVAS